MTPVARPMFEPLPSRLLADGEEAPRLSVIVPVTERPYPLEQLYREYAPALREHGTAFEFLFIVDRWTRELVDGLRGLIEEGEPIRVFEVGQRVGESGMLEGARDHVRGEIILTLPAYPRVTPAAVVELLRGVEDGPAEVATARRVSERDSMVGRVQRRIFHVLLRMGTGTSFHDVASGVRAMRRSVLEDVPMYGDLFRFLPVLAEREGFRVEEVPVTQHAEDARARVYSPGVYVRRLIDLLGLFFLVRFTRKPLRFFGLVGSVLAGFGSVILLTLFVERMQGIAIADRPLLLLGVLMFVTGIQAIAMGLIGEIIVHLHAGGSRPEYRVRKDSEA